MASVFSKIIAGEIPCYKVAEDADFFAFLDIMPLREGHVLVVPKTEVDHFFDVPDDILGAWLIFAKPIAKAIVRAFPCGRCGISVVGLEVPHAHMHLLPIDSADDLNFTRPKLRPTQEQLFASQQKILEFL